MRLEMMMKHKLDTVLKMAPHIIQSIEVLTLPALELENFVQEQLESNPVLETKEMGAEGSDGSAEPPVESERPLDEDVKNSLETLEREEWREYDAQDRIPKRDDGEKDKKLDAMYNTPSRPESLQDYIFHQFQLVDIPLDLEDIGENIVYSIGEHIIYNIDSRGYLQYPLEEIAKTIPCELEVVEQVLELVQSLEPAGIAARDLQECLLLQLDEDEDNHFERELIQKYLSDINNNRYPKIAKETGHPLEDIKRAVQKIQKLNPNPGKEYSSESIQFIMPDVVVERSENIYITRLHDDYIPDLQVNPYYLQLLQSEKSKQEGETKEYIKKKIESANWVVDAIKQRRQTLRRVAEQIVQHQTEFLDYGLTHLKPLKMQDIAEELEIHVSTVSRAISQKYIQTPRGIFPMRFFFTGGVDKEDGNNESRVTVQERVHEMIQKENKSNPLSDEDIANELKKAGLAIARRTVTKYRKALGIPSSRIRKEWN